MPVRAASLSMVRFVEFGGGRRRVRRCVPVSFRRSIDCHHHRQCQHYQMVRVLGGGETAEVAEAAMNELELVSVTGGDYAA